MHIHRRYLGEQIAFFSTDVGTLNQIVQIFAFADAETVSGDVKPSMPTLSG